MCLFQRFFHASLSTFPPFPTFSAFANFYNRKFFIFCKTKNKLENTAAAASRTGVAEAGGSGCVRKAARAIGTDTAHNQVYAPTFYAHRITDDQPRTPLTVCVSDVLARPRVPQAGRRRKKQRCAASVWMVHPNSIAAPSLP